MTTVSRIETDDSSVKARLIRAADAEIAEFGPDALQMEAVAKRAGVSRSTAFRQLHSLSEVLIQVALLRSQRHIAALRDLMSTEAGVFAKIEVALIYNARELPTDPSIAALIARHSAALHDPRVHEISLEVLGPVLREGQRRGEIRIDVHLDDLVDYLVEQTWLAAEEIDRSEEAVRKRFRQFVIPALEGVDGPVANTYRASYKSRKPCPRPRMRSITWPKSCTLPGPNGQRREQSTKRNTVDDARTLDGVESM
jgi:AcrR family transcriptional regulator